VQVKDRVTTVKSGRLWHGVQSGVTLDFDLTDVGGRVDRVLKTDDRGSAFASLVTPKAGVVDVVAYKTAANGITLYGAARLRVVDRSRITTFETTAGRVLQRTKSGFSCRVGPTPECAHSWLSPTASASGPLDDFVSWLRGVFGVSATDAPIQSVRTLADSAKITPLQIATSSSPLSGNARVIAAGAGHVIAAGGGQVIAAGGGQVIAAGGGHVIAAGGGQVIAAGGGQIIAAGAGNLIAAGGGMAMPLPDGGHIIPPSPGQVIAAGGGQVIAAGGGQVIAAGGGQVIAAGGGQVIAAGGANLWAVSGLQ
jgi:hypothetical protein